MSAEAAMLPHNRLQAGLRPMLLLIGVAAAVAAGVAVVLWSQGPTYSLLFGGLANADAAQVTQQLDASGIPYRLENGTGAIMVPQERVNDARLQLAAKGLPESGGFSLLDKQPGFGVSQFMENARYQHALESELAKTISSMKQVDGARVHLAVPQQSAFVRDRRPASASVFLNLKSGRRLDREQVTSIVNLVASSIPELDARMVTVIDAQGRLLSAPEKNGEEAEREQQLEIARRLEEDYSTRIESLLAPMIGSGHVHAQVVAQIEMSSTEEAREQYRPESQIVRNEQTSEETSRNGAGPEGIPGALTNQPPAGGTVAPLAAAAAPRPAAPGAANAAAAETPVPPPDNTSRSATRAFEIDRTVGYTRTPAGRLQRLSVAVLVDNLRATGADGKVTESALTEAQLAHMTTLVKDAVGFDEKRGDSVSVVNSPFLVDNTPPDTTVETVPIWERPFIRDMIRLLVGLIIAALVVLFVLKPLIRSLTANRPAPAGAGADGAIAGELEARTPMQTAQMTAQAYEQQVAQARNLVTKDPARVAQVVKAWVKE